MRRQHVRSCDEHPDWVKGCPPCLVKARLYEKRRAIALQQGRRLSAASGTTVVRLRELRAAGYGYRELSNRSARYDKPGGSGLGEAPIRRLCDGSVGRVQLRTYWLVERMYQDLRWFPGPDKRAATWAARKGWTPPELPAVPEVPGEDVIDMVAIRRAMAGDDSVCLTRAEKVAAWDLLGEQGMSASERIRFLRVGEASIARWRGGFIRKNAKRTA
jgi:hypothetical protein